MDIDGKIYCSKCMREIEEESICPFCHYDHRNEKNEASALEKGTFLNNRYQLGSVIGKGGFGITYAAWDETLDIPVAVKEYFPAEIVTRNTEYGDEVIIAENNRRQYLIGMQHFLRESRVLAMMKGMKGAVGVQDYFEENGTAYIVMEYIHGVPLGEYGKKHKLSKKQLFEMLKDPIDALIALHKQGVLHRDITPYNLLVQEDGSVKLIDFGSAAKIQRDQSMVVVTQKYAPVEQYLSKNSQLGAWTDVYGLSATIYEVLTGIVPQESIARAQKDELKPIDQTDVKLKPYQIKAIKQGLLVSPEKRTRSMEEFRSRLYNLPLPEEIRLRKKFMRKAGCLAALAVAFVLILAANFMVGLPFGSGLLYTLRSDGWHVVGALGAQELLVVPASRLGVAVSAIENYAFADHDDLESVTLQEGMKSIGSYAFAECDALRTIYLPDSLKEIKTNAFENNSRYLTVWGNDGSYAEAFAAQTRLAFSVRSDYEIMDKEDGTIAITSYTGDAEILSLPSVIDGKKVTALYQEEGGQSAFELPETVRELSLPEYLEDIPYSMFFSGNGWNALPVLQLEKITLNDHLKKIEKSAFFDCPLKEVVFSESLAAIDISAFSGTEILEIALPETVTELGNYAFSGAAVEKVVLPSSIEVWGVNSFFGCEKLQEVVLPDNMTEIPWGMFSYCSALKQILLPDSLKNIGKAAFEHCEMLECIKLPEGAESIEANAFANCYDLKYIDIPKSVEYISGTAFDGCGTDLVIGGYAGSLAQAYAKEHNIRFEDKGQWTDSIRFTEPGVAEITDLSDKNPVIPTYDEENHALVHTVTSASIYAEHESVRLPLFVERLEDSLFENDYDLAEIELPDSVRIICDGAFCCTDIGEVTIPDSVEVMEAEVFYACMNLKTASVGRNVGALNGTFRFCENLEDVYIYGKNTTIDETAFQNCRKLTIHAYQNSAAEKYAEEYGIPFEALDAG